MMLLVTVLVAAASLCSASSNVTESASAADIPAQMCRWRASGRPVPECAIDSRQRLYSSSCDHNTDWNYNKVATELKRWITSIRVVGSQSQTGC